MTALVKQSPTVNKGKTQHVLLFIPRWNALVHRKSTLDADVNAFCDELRSLFPQGAEGDRHYVTWCQQNLISVTHLDAREMLARAHAVQVFEAFK